MDSILILRLEIAKNVMVNQMLLIILLYANFARLKISKFWIWQAENVKNALLIKFTINSKRLVPKYNAQEILLFYFYRIKLVANVLKGRISTPKTIPSAWDQIMSAFARMISHFMTRDHISVLNVQIIQFSIKKHYYVLILLLFV